MANYYHEARAHAKNIKNMQDDNRRRAERRAEKAGVEAELPVNLLRIDGRSCLVTTNDEQYHAVQSMEGMIPMNGQHDNLIDRFDGRALLDFYREPVSKQARSKTEDELELEELLAFETFRDLVKLLQQNLTEEQGLIAAELRNIEERASARSAAAAAVGIQPAQPGGFAASAIPAGQGEFGAVGFSYDAPAESSLPSRAGGPVEDLGEEASSESDSGSEDDERGNNQACDLLAANLGIDHFSVMLRRADRQEEADAQGNVKRPKRLFSRKKAAQRAKRMAGQGLGAWGSTTAKGPPAGPRVSTHSSTHRLSRRDSPTYEYHGRKRSRSRSSSSSRSPSRRGRSSSKPQYISEFSVKASRHSNDSWRDLPTRNSHASSEREDKKRPDIVEALPHKADPAVAGGPVSLPSSAAVLHGVRASDYYSHSSSSSRDRYRSREPDKHQNDQRAAAPAQVANKKETPQERLKRLMAAQINKQVAKDSVKSAQKVAHEEKERKARVQIERLHYDSGRRSPSPDRYRDRSRSPPRRRY